VNDRSARAAISVDMGGTKIFGMLNTVDGVALAEDTLPTAGRQEDAALERLATLIEGLLNRAQAQQVTVAGIGVGVPGMTDEGSVVAAPALGWLDFPLAQRLEARFGLPVVIENDVNLAALGEYGFGAARGASSMICVAVGTGIGSGIVIDGRLYRGHSGSAGEIGYMIPEPRLLDEPVTDADFGAFERLASGTGIAMRARALLKTHNLDESLGATAAHVLQAADRGEFWAKQVIDETIDYLAQGLANIAAVLDPDVIVLSGGVMAEPERWIGPISERVRRVIPFAPPIVASALGPRATALGATVLLQQSKSAF